MPQPHAQRGLLVVISGPSGAGKTTIARQVEKRLGGTFSVSATTRPRSPGDVEGRDYYFMTVDQFNQRIDAGEFLEFAQVFGKHFYGTPRRPVEEALARGELMILEIDVQGGRQVKRAMPGAFMLFILPPSDEALQRRLRGRGRDDGDTIQRRLAEARREIELARETTSGYEHFIINDDLEHAIQQTCDLIRQRRDTMPQRPLGSSSR